MGSDRLRELEINVVEHVDVRPVDHRIIAVTQLEGNGTGKVSFLVGCEGVEKKLGVGEVLFEFVAACTLFNSFDTLYISGTLSVCPF